AQDLLDAPVAGHLDLAPGIAQHHLHAQPAGKPAVRLRSRSWPRCTRSCSAASRHHCARSSSPRRKCLKRSVRGSQAASRSPACRCDRRSTSRSTSARTRSRSRHRVSTGLGHDMRWSIHEGVTMPDSPSDRARAAWRTLTSRPVYANPWIRVREDIAELPDGRTTLYGVVECPPCVGVLPFFDARTVVLVGQWRYVA